MSAVPLCGVLPGGEAGWEVLGWGHGGCLLPVPCQQEPPITPKLFSPEAGCSPAAKRGESTAKVFSKYSRLCSPLGQLVSPMSQQWSHTGREPEDPNSLLPAPLGSRRKILANTANPLPFCCSNRRKSILISLNWKRNGKQTGAFLFLLLIVSLSL